MIHYHIKLKFYIDETGNIESFNDNWIKSAIRKYKNISLILNLYLSFKFDKNFCHYFIIGKKEIEVLIFLILDRGLIDLILQLKQISEYDKMYMLLMYLLYFNI